MARKILRNILLIFEIVLLIIVTLVYYLAQPIHLKSAQIYIPAGNIKHTVLYLNERIAPSFWLDSLVLRMIGSPQKGWIDLKVKNMIRVDFLYRLTISKAPLVPIKLIPGETTYYFLRYLSNEYGYDLNVLQKEYAVKAPYPEGVFFAETFYLPKGMEAKNLIDTLIKMSLRKHKTLAKKIYGNYNQKFWFERIVTIASIIQKEAADNEEMPLVASVIYNRLKKGIPLQMDGTLNYAQYSHTKITSQRIRMDRSKFNTYRHKGLPPYPICNVGLDAIYAALKPAKSDYLYFVKGVNGKHIFSKTYKNHLSNIKNVKKRNIKKTTHR